MALTYILAALLVSCCKLAESKPVVGCINALDEYNTSSATELLWPRGIVPYKFNDNIPVATRLVVQAAMSEIESKTCVRFTNMGPEEERDYFMQFKQRRFCGGSMTGMALAPTYHPQEFDVATTCSFSRLLSLIMRALGFYPEHTRFDRDRYIKILWGNISEFKHGNFYKIAETAGKRDAIDYGYDYASITHYSKNAFPKELNLATIVPIYPNGTIRNDVVLPSFRRTKLSPIDIMKINTAYDCNDIKIFGKKLGMGMQMPFQ